MVELTTNTTLHANPSTKPAPAPVPETAEPELTWPGQPFGLTVRESEIVALVCEGLSNQEIANNLYLSINSVKTYIRTAYRKIGVSTRTKAVLWGLDNGFKPEPMRVAPHS